MSIKKEPFRSYTLEEDAKDPLEAGKICTIRLNSFEYKQLQEDMTDFNIARETTMLKFLAEVGRNVLHGTFGRQKLRWLFNEKRIKKEMPD